MPDVSDVITGGVTDVGTLADKGPVTVLAFTPAKIGMPTLQTQDPYNPASPVGQAYIKYQQQSDAAAGAVAGMAGGGVGLATKAANTVAQGKSMLAAAQASADAKLEKDMSGIYSQLGLTPGAQSGAVLGLVQDINSGIQDVNARGKDILNKMDQGFLPDPIGWLVNQLELPYDIRARNTANINVLQRLQALHELSSFGQEQVNAAKALDTMDAVEKQLATNTIIRGEADASIAQAQFEASRIGIQAMSVRNSINQGQLNASIKLFDLQQDNNRMAITLNGQAIDLAKLDNDTYRTQLDRVQTLIRSESNERDKRQLQLAEANMQLNFSRDEREQKVLGMRVEELTLAKNRDEREGRVAALQTSIAEINLDDAQRKQAGIADVQQSLDKVTEVYNLNRMTYYQFAAMPDSPLKQFLASALTDPDTQRGMYGHDMIDSIDKMAAYRLKPPPGVGDFLGKIIAEDNKYVSVHKFELKGLSPQEQHVERQLNILKFVKDQNSNIGDTGNLFSPPPLAKMLEIPILGNNPIAADLKTLAATNPSLPSKVDDIFTFVADGMSKGKYTPSQGADFISNFYKSALQQVNSLTQVNRFGITGLKTSTGFNTTVHTGSLTSEHTDVSNRANVERLLTRMIVTKTMNEGIGVGILP